MVSNFAAIDFSREEGFMISMFSSANYADLVIIISGVLLCLKRIAEMERYHTLRVVVITAILSYFVILFFVGYGLTLGHPRQWDCTNDEEFCYTDM
jgi:hypothetical protein